MLKWIALTEDELKLVTDHMGYNEESLVDMLHYSHNNTARENAAYRDELTLTRGVKNKLESA